MARSRCGRQAGTSLRTHAGRLHRHRAVRPKPLLPQVRAATSATPLLLRSRRSSRRRDAPSDTRRAAACRPPVSSMKGRVVSSLGSRSLTFGVTGWVSVMHGLPGFGALPRGIGCVVAGRAWPGQAPCGVGVGDRRRLWALDAGGRVWQEGRWWWSWCSGGRAPVRWPRSGLGGGSSHPSGRAGRTRVSCGARGLNQPNGRPARGGEGGQTQERARPSLHLAPW